MEPARVHSATKTASCHHDSFEWAAGLLQADRHQNICRQGGVAWPMGGDGLVAVSTPALQHVRRPACRP
eukprot:scaffold58122_cov67-Phaeocystis_antarctica.AAC.9